ncbi:CHASE2 and HATPase_c domain-containing protein [Pollutimonas sp. M17]|uniref:CHASE2 and HATPase_c domain-containing protein n=1 Tax=Pollutimonas sp. M17 TaxID=2962065 RepID=UPI0021F3E36B|nr:CHASE2 and HATPase_c domain-containing protein [Pollutimonas sp. M17]UYO93710.1 CHASE2 and HATPase_c domain-containing protein [Pollutimonas sp. M17]
MPDAAQPAGTRFWGGLERRIRKEWLAVTLALAALTMALSYFSGALGLARLDHAFYDKALAASAYAAADTDIVIVAIDDGSIDHFGYWPWRRQLHAQLLGVLHQARVVGLDLVLSDVNPAYPQDDALLAQAIRRHGKVVLPLVVQADGRRAVGPVATLAESAAALGYINIQADGDGIIRSLALRQILGDGRSAEHFVAAMLSLHHGDSAAMESIQAKGQDRLLIPYVGVPGHFTIYSYAAVLGGRIPPLAFKDKYVLVGSWGSGLGDAFPTPLSRQGEAMSGVEILANALLAARRDNWILSPPRWLAAALACLPVLLACVALRRLSPRQSFLAVMGVLLLSFASCWLLMRYGRIWVPLTASLIGIGLALPVWSWRSQEASLQHIDRELLALQAERQGSGDAATPPETQPDGSLPARIAQLHGAIAQLRMAHRKRDETLRFLSHDMRAPQTSILALTQLQQEPGKALPQKELLERIDAYAGRTLGLVDGFVQLARAEAAPLSRRRVDLVELVAQCIDEFWAQARHRSIDIQFIRHPEAAWTMGDLSLLRRACCNLLDNALKYSADHTLVTCSIDRDADDWLLAIRDQGRGMQADQQATLFQPFSRIAQDGSGSPQGAGLGLAFVATVAMRHEGSIAVESREGLGSAFHLRLPASA